MSITIDQLIDENGKYIELDDLTYNMPSQDDPQYQAKIAGNKAFAELKSGVNEPIPERRKFYNYQKAMHRHSKVAPKSVITWQPGVGKTGTLGYVEEVRDESLNSVVDWVDDYINGKESHFKRVIILVKNDQLMEQVKRDIICKFSKEETYKTEKLLKSKESSIKGNITRELNKFYIIDTYKKFALNLNKNKYTNEDYRKIFSRCVFWCDEIQTLRIESTNLDDDTMSYNDRKIKAEKKERRQKIVYDIFWNLFHNVDGCKFILSTATTMINAVYESGMIMNLILDKNNQMPVGRNSSSFYINSTKEDYAKYYNGLISYVAQSGGFAIPDFQGVPLGKSYNFKGVNIKHDINVYPLEMVDKIDIGNGKFIDGQMTVYDRVSRSTVDTSFRLHERQVSSFIFPDGTYGYDGISKWIRNGTTKDLSYYEPIDELIPYIRNNNILYGLAIKFYAAIKISDTNPGNVFIFTPHKGSGAFLLGMCFRYNQGYEEFIETSGVIYKDDRFSSNICNEETSIETDNIDNKTVNIKGIRIRPSYPKKKRYAIITSGMKQNQVEMIMKVFNSWENRHGDYIKVLIATPLFREGTNVFNVLTYIPMEAGWTPGNYEQALNRVFRADSHIYLLEEEKAKLRAEGKDESLAKIYVKIYPLVTVRKKFGLNFTSDISMYEALENKEITFKYIENIQQYYAWDGLINRERNQKSRESNIINKYFGNIGYVNQEPDTLYTHLYDNVYSDDDINNIIKYISVTFSNIFSITIDQLITKMNDEELIYPKSYVVKALYKMIKEKIKINDRYGYTSYIKSNGNNFYVDRDFPIYEGKDDNSSDYYSNNLIAITSTNLDDYIFSLNKNKNMIIKNALLEFKTVDDNFIIMFNQLPNVNKLDMFEKSVINIHINKSWSDIDMYIYNLYKDKYLYYIYEPYQLINKVYIAISNRGKGRGAKPKKNTIPTFDVLKLQLQKIPASGDPGVSNEAVFIHSLYDLLSKTSQYAASSNITKTISKLRILKPSENIGWRDLNLYETVTYKEIINKLKQLDLNRFETLPFYGFILKDGILRIRNKLNEKANANGQNKNRGKVATSYNIPMLYKFLWLSQAPIDTNISNIQSYETKYMKLYHISGMDTPSDPIRSFDINRLNYYYALSELGYNKANLSNLLKNTLKQLGWLIEK